MTMVRMALVTRVETSKACFKNKEAENEDLKTAEKDEETKNVTERLRSRSMTTVTLSASVAL